MQHIAKIDWSLTGAGTSKRGPLQSTCIFTRNELLHALTAAWDEELKMGPVCVELAGSSPEDRISIPEPMRIVVLLGVRQAQP